MFEILSALADLVRIVSVVLASSVRGPVGVVRLDVFLINFSTVLG
jgi:hypothetical protein